MIGESHLTKEVFGIQRNLPLNYVTREADEVLKDSLDRKHHVVIYGSSKQGKTSLRKKNLKEDDYIIIHCSHKWDIYQLNINILKQVGFEIIVSEKKTTSGKFKVNAIFGINLFTKTEIGTEVKGSKHREIETKGLEIDPEDVNDLIRVLNELGFSKFIVLEDFHYLKPETQKDFAIELKAFHENSMYSFIIVGVWLEENRLIALNGDLSGRVKSVNADHWDKEELLKLVNDGECLLNVKFPTKDIIYLIEKSIRNVHIVQEVCYELCKANNITETQNNNTRSIDCSMIDDLINKVIGQHSGRYNKFITSFSEGFQATELEMHKWILYVILTCEEEKMNNGIRRSDFTKILEEDHPKGKGLNPGNLTQALNSVASLQVKKEITPIIVDYDTGAVKLNVVDKGFIIWLKNQNLNEVLINAGLPPTSLD